MRCEEKSTYSRCCFFINSWIRFPYYILGVEEQLNVYIYRGAGQVDAAEISNWSNGSKIIPCIHTVYNWQFGSFCASLKGLYSQSSCPSKIFITHEIGVQEKHIKFLCLAMMDCKNKCELNKFTLLFHMTPTSAFVDRQHKTGLLSEFREINRPLQK